MAKPKIVSLFKDCSMQQHFPQLKLMGRPQSLFVECQSYDLIIEVRSSQAYALDIFGDAVPRMIYIQVDST